MKKKIMSRDIVCFLFVALFSTFLSCKSGENPSKELVEIQTIDQAQLVGEETDLMLAYLNELGDYVNSRKFPSLIKASSVYEGLGNKQLVVDIRNPELFSNGHIKGAVNINFRDSPEYFESKIVPFEYDKIIVKITYNNLTIIISI